MTITTTKTVTEERVIHTPCFWKLGYFYFALLDENNMYQVLLMNDSHSIWNTTPLKTLLETYNNNAAELITEEQFFSAYSEAREATNLEPKLKSEDFLSTITSALQLQPKEY
jgi:hypothetical protein